MRYIYFFLLLFLSGCASAPRDALTFDQVQLPQPNEEQSVLVFHRLFTPPAASDMRVSINDKKIVALPNNTFSYIKLPAGNYDLKISWSPLTGVWRNTKQLIIAPNQTKYLQLNSSVYTAMGVELGSSKHDPSNKEAAEILLRECCKYVQATEL
ncbi:hypothetical protein [Pseudoalteromonas sp. SR41-7]|uniref:hypothetical protein n=1 Tax=Pseudoalteromonas sp. SR41-7 TaxID=2760947 RepID=UPI0015FEEFFA|nr:hypothetical protein [Pseudoalteromonas sp. SR41-7]MBB1297540.1 hypothetical protein [Pseudoalteromonas sp. SR41-7]